MYNWHDCDDDRSQPCIAEKRRPPAEVCAAVLSNFILNLTSGSVLSRLSPLFKYVSYLFEFEVLGPS